MKKAKKNVYSHSIDLQKLIIQNTSIEEFRTKLINIQYRGYEVETLSDQRKIVITKPGGKISFGRISHEDFMVWIFDPSKSELWLISHKNILEDLREKAEKDALATIRIIDALEKVYKGEEPDTVLSEMKLQSPSGEAPEVLLKAYKWIWGQEDVNYPTGKGRAMSWEGIKKNEHKEWVKTGDGIVDLRDKLLKKK